MPNSRTRQGTRDRAAETRKGELSDISLVEIIQRIGVNMKPSPKVRPILPKALVLCSPGSVREESRVWWPCWPCIKRTVTRLNRME